VAVVGVLLAVAASLRADEKPGAALVLHVSPAGDDRWSGRLAEPAAAGEDGPLATPQRARDALRERRKTGPSPDTIEVRLHAGRYRLSEPLAFTPEDSGPIVWRAAAGEAPVLSGAVPIEGWRVGSLRGMTVWTADVSAIVRSQGPFRSLFVNGERRPRPRLPKDGLWRIESVPERPPGGDHWKTLFEGSDAFVAARGTVQAWWNLADVEAVVLHFWIEERLPLVSFDPATRLVRTGRKTLMALVDEAGDAGPRYYVENVFEALAPGEWYLDRPSGRLHYAPRPGEQPATTLVEVPVLDSLLKLEGEPEKERFVEGLRLEGLSFEHSAVPAAEPAVQAAWTTPGAIVLRGARNVAIEDGRMAGLGGYAVEIGEGCRDVRLVGNEIVDVGAGGVTVTGATDAARDTRHVTITDNHIHAIGRVFPSAVGVLVRHAPLVTVAHNHIHDTYYTAVSAGWVWGYGPNVTCLVRIEKNHIHDIGQGLLSDMGGIYTLGVQPGSVIRGNLVHGVRAAGYGGWAIYPDEGSSFIEIEDNVAFDTTGHVFHQHYGNENTVRNNVLAFGDEGVLALSRGPSRDPQYGGREARAFRLARNILVTDGKPVIATGLADDAAEAADRPFLSDLNLFWDVSGAPVALGDGRGAGTGGLRKAYDLPAWQALGLDRHSIATDPRFVDLAGRDFRLTPDSPAFALGFRPIDLSDVGPRPRGRRGSVPGPVE
jgi:hypothetical protein